MNDKKQIAEALRLAATYLGSGMHDNAVKSLEHQANALDPPYKVDRSLRGMSDEDLVMTDEDLTIQSLDRWAKRQSKAGKGVDAYTLRQAAITLERVVVERDRLRDAIETHRDNMYGEDLEIDHDEDKILYIALQEERDEM